MDMKNDDEKPKFHFTLQVFLYFDEMNIYNKFTIMQTSCYADDVDVDVEYNVMLQLLFNGVSHKYSREIYYNLP